jgi:hypothetical protein
MADGLERALDKHPEWPPAAAQFRALCLDRQTDAEGNDLIKRVGIYETRLLDEVVEYDANGRVVKIEKKERSLAIESDEIKERREKTASQTLNSLTDMFKDAKPPEHKNLRDHINEIERNLSK